MTIDGETQAYCGVGSVRIRTDSGESAKANVLVTQKDIPGFELLLGYNAINCAISGGPYLCHTLH